MRCIEDVTESADVGRSKAAVDVFEVRGGGFSTCVALGSTAGRHGHQNHSTHIGRRSGAPWTFARPSFSCDPLRRCRRSLRAAKNWPPVMRSPWAYGLKSCKTYGSKSRTENTAHHESGEGFHSICFGERRSQQTEGAPCRCSQRSRPCTSRASTPAPHASRPDILPAPRPPP